MQTTTIRLGGVPEHFNLPIHLAIEDGSFYTNPALDKAVDDAAQQDRAVHVFGLLSPGGVHSHEDHIFALLKMAKQNDGMGWL